LKDNPVVFDSVSRIARPQLLGELAVSVTAFLDYARANKRLERQLCEQLSQALIQFSQPYLEPSPGRDMNVVFIPPEAAPVMMIPSCVPIMGDSKSMISGLHRFLERCGEFSKPIEDRVTEAEMESALGAAQEKFGILDIIAHFRPLKIISLDNSHRIRNCECGITDGYSSEAVIFVYHPRDVSVYDRVFIFAHEIGHALHLALTHDIDRIPSRFDEFNEALGIKSLTLQQKQETFADAAAIAILHCDELRNHLPAQLLEQLPPYFEKYIGYVTGDYFKKLHWER
jgi:Zn-dependent peptidase ImmA (M78 family)